MEKLKKSFYLLNTTYKETKTMIATTAPMIVASRATPFSLGTVVVEVVLVVVVVFDVVVVVVVVVGAELERVNWRKPEVMDLSNRVSPS
ncbi:MAG: hypothetical protein OWQ52_09835, partial [Metallosphaera prunae]|uniref:hypothetical protein n=1 Tax=Metallosphaera prunae TaxID=47304 RepID=UPI00227589DA